MCEVVFKNIDLRCFVVTHLFREFTYFFGVPFTGLKNMVAYQKWQIWGMCGYWHIDHNTWFHCPDNYMQPRINYLIISKDCVRVDGCWEIVSREDNTANWWAAEAAGRSIEGKWLVRVFFHQSIRISYWEILRKLLRVQDERNVT